MPMAVPHAPSPKMANLIGMRVRPVLSLEEPQGLEKRQDEPERLSFYSRKGQMVIHAKFAVREGSPASYWRFVSRFCPSSMSGRPMEEVGYSASRIAKCKSEICN